jgi:Raf kinase inhibitor-like YbhB/YbcL family protein
MTVIALAVSIAGGGVLGACASSDGRSLPEAKPDQTGSIVTTTTLAAGGVVDDPAAIATTVPPTAAPAVEDTLPAISDAAPTTVDPAAPAPAAEGFSLQLPWAPDGAILGRHACSGDVEQNIAPAVQWANVPPGSAELAIVMTDTSAGGFAHWIVTGIDPNSTGVPENALSATAINQINDSGAATYLGPCPPDSAPHQYVVELLALSQQYEPTGADPATIIAELRALSIGAVSQAGVFAAA